MVERYCGVDLHQFLDGEHGRFRLGLVVLGEELELAAGRAAGLEGESQTTTAGVMYPWLRSRTASRRATHSGEKAAKGT